MNGWEGLAGGDSQPAPKKRTLSPASALPKEEKVEEKPVEQAPQPVVEETAPVTSGAFISQYPGIAAEMQAQADAPTITPSHTFCAFVGHEGTGKTGLAYDAHKHRHPDGLAIVLDHDNGGLSCKQAHYGGDPSFRVFSPWVMQQEDRTAYNYLASYNRVMEICKFAVEYAEQQQQPGFEGQPLRSFIVTGVDQFDDMCIVCMKIFDLDLKATDAIEASHAKLNKEIGWNWNIRGTRFKQLTQQCQKLNRLGVDVYWETHLKEDKDGTKGHDGWKFAWHSSANKDLFQIVWCNQRKVRNAEGAYTGEDRYSAKFFKQKTNSDLLNQERLYFSTKEGEKAQWYGLPELRDGLL